MQSCYIVITKKNCSTANSNINEDKKEKRRIDCCNNSNNSYNNNKNNNIQYHDYDAKKERERKEIYHIMKVS